MHFLSVVSLRPSQEPICMQVKQQQLENRTWNNGLAPNWERSMSRLDTVTLLT